MGMQISNLRDKLAFESDKLEKDLKKLGDYFNRNNIPFNEKEAKLALAYVHGNRCVAYAQSKKLDMQTYEPIFKTFFGKYMDGKKLYDEDLRTHLQRSGIISVYNRAEEKEFEEAANTKAELELDKVKELLINLKNKIVQDSSGTKYKITDISFDIELISKLGGKIKL